MKGALLQLTSSDDPAANRARVIADLADAAGLGAQFILTPEVTNCVSSSRARQQDVLCQEADDETLRAEAIEWQATRGSRSGRVAWQYFTDLAGRRGVSLSDSQAG